MKFSRVDNWHARSTCGRYTVTTDQVTNDTGCYIAWRARDGRTPAKMLAAHHYRMADEAMRQAARDAAVKACVEDTGAAT